MIARILRSTAFRVLVTAAILAFLLRDVDLGDTAAAVLRLDPSWFILTLLLVAIDRAVMVVRWQMLLRSAGVVLPAGSAVRIFLVSSFVGSFLPAGVGGDASRAYAVATRTDRGADAVASVAIDRLLGLVAIVLVGALGLTGWAQHLPASARLRLTAAAAVVVLGCAAALWMDRLVRRGLPSRSAQSGWGRRLVKLGDAVGMYRQRHATLWAVFALSIAVQAVRVLQGYTLGRGMGIAVGLDYYLVFMPVGLLLMLLPVSISGFGLPQGAIVWMLEPVGVPAAEAFALSTLIVLLGLVGNLPGAFLYLGRKKPLT